MEFTELQKEALVLLALFTWAGGDTEFMYEETNRNTFCKAFNIDPNDDDALEAKIAELEPIWGNSDNFTLKPDIKPKTL